MSKANAKHSKMHKYAFFWPVFLLLPFIVFFFLFNLYPILYSFYLSLMDWKGVGEMKFVGFDNYIRIFTKDKVFWISLWNTVKIGLAGFPIAIILGLISASFLSRVKRFKNFFQTANFLPYITTPVAIGLIFIFIFDRNAGIVNKIIEFFGGSGINWTGDGKYAPFVIALMIIWKCTGYYMVMYLAGITSISEDVYEAARVDGASGIQTFFKITVPLLKPITIFLIITSIIYALQLFDEPNLMFNVTTTSIVGGPERSCLTMVWNFYDIAFGANARLSYGSALASVLFVIIVIAYIIGLKVMNRKEEE